MQDQSDFLVVGVVGKTGVGKSTVMSLLAGTRTGAGKYVQALPSTYTHTHTSHHPQHTGHSCFALRVVKCGRVGGVVHVVWTC